MPESPDPPGGQATHLSLICLATQIDMKSGLRGVDSITLDGIEEDGSMMRCQMTGLLVVHQRLGQQLICVTHHHDEQTGDDAVTNEALDRVVNVALRCLLIERYTVLLDPEGVAQQTTRADPDATPIVHVVDTEPETLMTGLTKLTVSNRPLVVLAESRVGPLRERLDALIFGR